MAAGPARPPPPPSPPPTFFPPVLNAAPPPSYLTRISLLPGSRNAARAPLAKLSGSKQSYLSRPKVPQWPLRN